jgi:predicted aspartyl protease
LRIILPLYGYFIGFIGSLLLFFPGDKPFAPPTQLPVISDSFFQTQFHTFPANKKQVELSEVSPTTVLTIPTDTSSFIIPLRRIGRLYVMEATVDGESGNLIFDTGATNLVLNRTYFRDHVKSGEQLSSGITGSVSQADKVTANELAIGDLKFERLTANLADLGHIENRRGIKVLGLFGFGLIKSFEITFDVANSKLILSPIDNKGNLLNATKQFKADFSQKVETVNNVLFVKATIGEKLLRFCFDTGAESNALDNDLDKSILQTISITRTIKLNGAGSFSREVIYGIMNNFLFGDTLIDNMETIITYLDHLNEAYGIHIDGVLGFDFISKGNFCFNFVKKQMGISYVTKVNP